VCTQRLLVTRWIKSREPTQTEEHVLLLGKLLGDPCGDCTLPCAASNYDGFKFQKMGMLYATHASAIPTVHAAYGQPELFVRRSLTVTTRPSCTRRGGIEIRT
jgi:hypothetical protein